MHTFDEINAASLRSDVPEFRAGDTLKVHVKVIEGTRSRVQVFQGVVIRRHGGGIGETFTVRKISFGVGVERTFPVHTPVIDKIEVVTRGGPRAGRPGDIPDVPRVGVHRAFVASGGGRLAGRARGPGRASPGVCRRAPSPVAARSRR